MAETNGTLRRFTGAVLLLSWGIPGGYLVARMKWPQIPPLDGGAPIFLFATCAPSLVAIWLTYIRAGPAGLQCLFARLVRPFRWPWLIASVLALPALAITVGIFHTALAIRTHLPHPAPVPTAGVLSVIILAFNVPAWGEELGWRGFALPALLAKFKPGIASVILAAMRIIWHAPAFAVGGLMATSWQGFGWWAMSTLGLTLFMTVLYRRANANLLVCGIIPHTFINSLGALGFWTDGPATALVMLVFSVLLFFATEKLMPAHMAERS